MALTVIPEGMVTSFGLAPANCDERLIGDALIAEDHYDAYLADKGFSRVEWKKQWLKAYGALVSAIPERTAHLAWAGDGLPMGGR